MPENTPGGNLFNWLLDKSLHGEKEMTSKSSVRSYFIINIMTYGKWIERQVLNFKA